MTSNLFLYSAVFLITMQVAVASNEDPHIATNMPPLHPIDQKVVPETFVPEFGYYFTQRASQENVILGPCSPCVCMQICNTKNSDECLYIHQHHLNDPQEPANKITEHFTPSHDSTQQPNIDLTVFTCTEQDIIGNYHFVEGSHKKRIAELIESIEDNNTLEKKTIYYNQTSAREGIQNGYSDRTIMFKAKQPYTVNTKEQEGIKDLDGLKDHRFGTYLDLQLRKKFANRVYNSKTNSIWRRADNSLFLIKKPNIQKINNLPPSTEWPLSRYFTYNPLTKLFSITCNKEDLLIGALTTAIFMLL